MAIPAARARIAQDALLGALDSLLEAACQKSTDAGALTRMDEVAELCADGARVAAVIALLGRRALPRSSV
jgi:hypothetical protein